MYSVKVFVEPEFIKDSRITRGMKKVINENILNGFYKSLEMGNLPDGFWSIAEAEGNYAILGTEIKPKPDLTKLVIREIKWIDEEVYKLMIDTDKELEGLEEIDFTKL